MRIRDKHPGSEILVISYCNEYFGNLPGQQEEDDGQDHQKDCSVQLNTSQTCNYSTEYQKI
jgi:hypothetical protein